MIETVDNESNESFCLLQGTIPITVGAYFWNDCHCLSVTIGPGPLICQQISAAEIEGLQRSANPKDLLPSGNARYQSGVLSAVVL